MSMNRRDLLDPRTLAHVAGGVVGALDPIDPTPPPAEELALVRLGWRAMATRWEVVVPFDTPDTMALGQETFDLLDALEDQLTVYRGHSEVSRLNATAAFAPVVVESRLFQLLQLAHQISAATGGAFDVTTGLLIKAWGFFQGPRRVPDPATHDEVRQAVGYHHLALDADQQSVRFLRRLELNLGSVGKGYALDRMAEALAGRQNLPAALLHGGSSSVYAKGCPHGAQRGWPVRVRHPWVPGRYLAEVVLRDRALGTSAATFQYLEHHGKKLGHVLDPRTGWPAAGVASASVVASSAAVADALSTAFYVGGVDLARRYCADHPDVGAVLLADGDRDVTVINLSPATCTPL